MPLYRGNNPLKPYVGDGKPLNVYLGSTKLAGWTLQSYSGASLDVTGTYEDYADVTVTGNTVVHNGVFSSVEGKRLISRGKNLLSPSIKNSITNGGVTLTYDADTMTYSYSGVTTTGSFFLLLQFRDKVLMRVGVDYQDYVFSIDNPQSVAYVQLTKTNVCANAIVPPNRISALVCNLGKGIPDAVMVYGVSVGIGLPVSGSFKVQAERGTTPTKIVHYVSPTTVATPTLRKVGSVADTYVPATGAYVKAISDPVTLDGSKPWIWSSSNSSYTAVLINLSPNPLSITALVTKYDGSVLPTPGGAPDRYAIGLPSGLYLTLGYPDTGWNPTMTPTAAEIKAYFYGWRMCNADGSSPYTGGTKNWQHVTDGLGQTATLPTASYTGYTPYRMLYQLATPVTTTQMAKVMPTYRDETVVETDADAWCQPTISATVKSMD